MDRIKQREPGREEIALIDIGLDNLLAIVTTTGAAALIKGRAVKAEHYREETEIRAAIAIKYIMRSKGPEPWKSFHDRFLKAWIKRYERLRHLYRKAIRFTAERLHARRLKGHT